jgi:hypothetical protein
MPNPGVSSEGPSDPHLENLYRYFLEANKFRDNTQFCGKEQNGTSQTPIQSQNSYANVQTSPFLGFDERHPMVGTSSTSFSKQAVPLGLQYNFLNPSCVPEEPELRRQEDSPRVFSHSS